MGTQLGLDSHYAHADLLSLSTGDGQRDRQCSGKQFSSFSFEYMTNNFKGILEVTAFLYLWK